MHIHRVHLVLTYPVTHLGLLVCEEPPLARGTRMLPWSGSWLWIPDAAPNPVSQPLLSSMVESGRTAEQISLCFPTPAKAAPANTHQHSGTWRQLTFFSSLWAAIFLYCFYFRVCENSLFFKGEKKLGIGFIKQQLLVIWTFKSFSVYCWTNCYFLYLVKQSDHCNSIGW